MERLDDLVREAALILARAEEDRDIEFIRLVDLEGLTTYMAQRRADMQFHQRIRLAQAEYEIALARFRRS